MSPETKSSKRHAAPADSKATPEGSSSIGGSKSGSIGRAVRLLDLVTSDGPLRFAELKELSQIPKATLHRLINELAQERMVQYATRAMTWSAGYRVLEMANRIWTRSDIRMLTTDQLLALNALSGETVQLAVLADSQCDCYRSCRKHPKCSTLSNTVRVGRLACAGKGVWCQKG